MFQKCLIKNHKFDDNNKVLIFVEKYEFLRNFISLKILSMFGTTYIQYNRYTMKGKKITQQKVGVVIIEIEGDSAKLSSAVTIHLQNSHLNKLKI